MLGLDDHASMARPGASAIAEFVEQTLRYAASGKAPGGPLAQGGRVGQEARVLGHADHVMDVILLAPGQEQRPTESRVAAEDDAHARPRLAQAAYEELENCRRMQSRILLRWTQKT